MSQSARDTQMAGACVDYGCGVGLLRVEQQESCLIVVMALAT
jgi:hypothetical protein